LPAASTTLQWVEGNISLRPCPFAASVLTLTAFFKIGKDKPQMKEI
jgi:hypothetical protein